MYEHNELGMYEEPLIGIEQDGKQIILITQEHWSIRKSKYIRQYYLLWGLSSTPPEQRSYICLKNKRNLSLKQALSKFQKAAKDLNHIKYKK